jgi:hypothetical protein
VLKQEGARFFGITDGGKVSDAVAFQEVPVGYGDGGTDNPGTAPAIFGYLFIIRKDDGGFFVSKEGELAFQLTGEPKVVTVQEGDVPAPDMPEGQIPGLEGGTGMGRGKEKADTAVFFGVSGGDIRAAVGGAIIYDDKFPILKGLSPDAFDGLGNIGGAVVIGGND